MRDWLLELRNEAKLTQEDVAIKCGFSREFYTQVESGNRNPSVKNAKLIAKLLGFEWTLFFEKNSNEVLTRKEAG